MRLTKYNFKVISMLSALLEESILTHEVATDEVLWCIPGALIGFHTIDHEVVIYRYGDMWKIPPAVIVGFCFVQPKPITVSESSFEVQAREFFEVLRKELPSNLPGAQYRPKEDEHSNYDLTKSLSFLGGYPTAKEDYYDFCDKKYVERPL